MKYYFNLHSFNQTLNLDGDHDIVHTGSGNDIVNAGDGNNYVNTGFGNDHITSGSGNDQIIAGGGNDFLETGAGNDSIVAGNGDDHILTGTGNDHINAGNGDDYILAGKGSDTVYGMIGNDTFVHSFQPGDSTSDYDNYLGGMGQDTLLLNISADDLQRDDVQRDLAAFEAHNSNPWRKAFVPFVFESMNLKVHSIESLELNVLTATDDVAELTEDENIAVDVTDNDSLTSNESITLSGVNLLGDAGTVSIEDDNIVFDTNDEFEHLQEGESETVTIQYVIENSYGIESVATLTLTVTGTNDVPVVTEAITGGVEENHSVEIDVLSTVTDVDSEIISLSEVNVIGEKGTATISVDGKLVFTAGSEFDYLAEGETTTVDVEYIVQDEQGGTATAVATVEITGTNDAPVINETITGTVEENHSVEIDILSKVTDVDSDVISLSEVSVIGEKGTATISADGNLVFTAGSEFDYLAEGETTTVDVEYVVQDEQGGTATAMATIEVTGAAEAVINNAPVAQNVELKTALTLNSTFDKGLLGWSVENGPFPGPNGEEIVDGYTTDIGVNTAGNLIPGDEFVAVLEFSGWLNNDGDGPNIGTVFGPGLNSSEFSGLNGDIVRFTYKAFGGDDAAYIRAELVNVDTQEVSEIFLDETPMDTTSPVQELDVPLTASGNYQIRFSVGSFDSTDGGLVGAKLAIGEAGVIREGVSEVIELKSIFKNSVFVNAGSDADIGDILSLNDVSSTSELGAQVVINQDGDVSYDASNAVGTLHLLEGEVASDTFDFTLVDTQGNVSNAAAATVEIYGTTKAELNGDDLRLNTEQSGTEGNDDTVTFINSSDLVLDFSVLDKLSSVEVIDISGDQGVNNTISIGDVLVGNSDNNTINIIGNQGDQVNLEGYQLSPTASSAQDIYSKTVDGESFHVIVDTNVLVSVI